MDKRRAVHGVFAVITSIVMPATDIHRPRIHEWIEAGGDVFQLRRGMARIVLKVGRFLAQAFVDGFEFASHGRHLRWCGVTCPMNKTGERQLVSSAATLMVKTQRISPRKGRGHSRINEKWKGCA